MKSPFKISQRLNESRLHNEIKNFLELKFDKYYKENKDTIDNYLYFKSKLEEMENRLNLKHKLTVYNLGNSEQIVYVKVKLPFAFNKDDKSKYPFFNIYIGKLSNYKEGLEDLQLKKDVEEKIKEYVNSKYPFSIINSNNETITFYH